MFKSYFKVAFRNILWYKGYSFINILGLAAGLACCLVILVFVQDELSYDRFNEKADRIYRVNGFLRFGGRDMQTATSPAPMAAALVRDFPGVEDAFRFRQGGEFIFQYGEQSFKEQRVVYADSNFFNFFTIPLLQGNPETALAVPGTMIISRKTADKYFASADPIGKTLELNNNGDYKVTGVFEEIPHNSHFHFDMIISISSLEESRNQKWLDMDFNTYVLLHPSADPAALEAKFPQMIAKYVGPQVIQYTGATLDDLRRSGGWLNYRFMPLRDIHLHSDLINELEPNSDIKYIYIFSAIAIFILLIACINFMNLATARAAGRAKEVGIRKTVGSVRRQLVKQFLSESLLMSGIALVVAIGLIDMIIPFFNDLSGKELSLQSMFSASNIALMIVITLFTGLLAGSYPAFYISSFRPIQVLKGQYRPGRKKLLRHLLVVFQFTASIILIIGTGVIYHQLHYIQGKKLGFIKEQVLVIDNTHLLNEKAETFKNEILGNTGIINGTISGYLPIPSNRSSSATFPEGFSDMTRATTMQHWKVDYDYIATMGMKIIEGRNFSREYSTDFQAVILNRAAVRQFNWDKPLEKKITHIVNSSGSMASYQVIGVVEDFHFDSLRNNIQPLVMFIGKSTDNELISFRVKTSDLQGLIGFIKEKWLKFVPGQPFEYFFMDEKFDEQYRAEQQLGKVFTSFAILAVFIGCLGLFGLATFTAGQRTKEIGVRKVLGATIPNIISIVGREFVFLVAIANMIAWPIAYYVMNRWLQDFYYRGGMSIWIFVLSAAAVLVIAVLTVTYQSLKAALADPVQSLHYE